MPTFAFEAMNSSGQEVKDEVDANDSQEAIAKIRQKGYFPTKVREKAGKKKVAKKGKEDVTNIDMDLRAQEGLLAAKRKEGEQINARYDDDKKRYAELTRKK